MPAGLTFFYDWLVSLPSKEQKQIIFGLQTWTNEDTRLYVEAYERKNGNEIKPS
jgi:hypothetical protein